MWSPRLAALGCRATKINGSRGGFWDLKVGLRDSEVGPAVIQQQADRADLRRLRPLGQGLVPRETVPSCVSR